MAMRNLGYLPTRVNSLGETSISLNINSRVKPVIRANKIRKGEDKVIKLLIDIMKLCVSNRQLKKH